MKLALLNCAISHMLKKEFLISKSFWTAKSDSDTTFGNEENIPFSTYKTFLAY